MSIVHFKFDSNPERCPEVFFNPSSATKKRQGGRKAKVVGLPSLSLIGAFVQ